MRLQRRKYSKLQPATKRKRSPVTIEHLQCLFRHLDLTNSFDAVVFAVATVAFWRFAEGTHGQPIQTRTPYIVARLEELILPDATAFNPSRHVSRDAMPILTTTAAGLTFYSPRIPWSKTTDTSRLTISIPANNDPSCPVTALTHHMQCRSSLPRNAPFFSCESHSRDGWSPMTREWFMSRCNEVWTAHGLQPLTGHCFRIGGATELLLRGTPPGVVALQGSWRSRAFLEYWRQIEDILPLFISNSFTLDRATRARKAMRAFAQRYNS